MSEGSPTNDNDPFEDHRVDRLLGRALRRRREELNLSTAALAVRASIPAADIARYEAGELKIPSLALVHLADALDAPLSHFLKAI